MSKARLDHVDIVRGLSIIGIIIAHSYTTYNEIWLWGNGFAPMWFALLIGYSMSLSSLKTPLSFMARGVSLYVLGLFIAWMVDYVIIILPVLGMALICVSWAVKFPRIYSLYAGVAVLVANPFIVSVFMAIFGTPNNYVMDVTNIVSIDGWLTLLTGTYPLVEWTGLILVGYGLSSKSVSAFINPVGNIARTTISAIIAMAMSFITATACVHWGQWGQSMKHMITPPSSVSMVEKLFIPFGHSGSWASFIIGISSFISAMAYAQIYSHIAHALKLNIHKCVSVLGTYSLSAYVLSSLLISAGGSGGFAMSIAYITMVMVIFLVLNKIGVRDPLSALVSMVARAIEKIFRPAFGL